MKRPRAVHPIIGADNRMGRASRRKRSRVYERDSPEARLAARVVSRLENVAFRHPEDRPPDLAPLSERLVTLMAPYRDEATTLHAYQALSAMAVLNWHLSSRPDSEHEHHIARAIRRANLPDPAIFRSIVTDLIQRKKRLFPDDSRLIAGHEVSLSPNGFHLVVASASVEGA